MTSGRHSKESSGSPPNRKDDVIKETGLQLKTWRKNLRSKYFANLDVAGIKALKDRVPDKEKIPLHQWNAFIEHEATDAKLQQREIYKNNRAQKNDVHCLGRKSYAEKANEMKSKNPVRRSLDRSEVYVESRKQQKTGQLHPNTVSAIQKINELKSSQDSTSQVSLDNDALTQVFGKDNRGRTRGVGPVSKGKVKAIIPLKSDIDRVVHSNENLEVMVYGIRNELTNLVKAFNQSQHLVPPQFSQQRSPNLSTPEPSTFPSPTPSTPSYVQHKDLKNKKVIASGFIVPEPSGKIVHGRPML